MRVRRTRQLRRTAAAAGFVAAAGLAFGVTPIAASVAVAAPASAETPTAAESECTVTSAELSWGLKTSFRNYISGSIANGEWVLENGTTYETPAFQWSNGEGAFASDLSEGSVAFTGDVFFNGHDGLMRLDVSNPEIVFTGGESAQLVLDIGSDDTGAGSDITQERVVAAKIDLAGYDAGDGSTFTATDAPVALTADGAAALNGAFGDYVSGEEMDPLTLNLAVSGCELTSSENEPATTDTAEADENEPGSTETTESAAEAEAPPIPWVPIVIGGAALAVVGVTAGLLIAGRKK